MVSCCCGCFTLHSVIINHRSKKDAHREDQKRSKLKSHSVSVGIACLLIIALCTQATLVAYHAHFHTSTTVHTGVTADNDPGSLQLC
jgi:hypothetical protein